MLTHLRASRYLITELLKSGLPTDRHVAPDLNSQSFGFSIEIYMYLAFSNTVTSFKAQELKHVELPLPGLTMKEMELFPTFGVLFAGGHELFQLTPEICQLASRRLAEEQESKTYRKPSLPLRKTYEDLYQRIVCWEMPPRLQGETITEWRHKRNAAEILRQALSIFLATALQGSLVSDANVLCAIEQHIMILFGCMENIVDKVYSATLLWPLLIGGSCLTEPEQQRQYANEAREEWCDMWHVKKFIDALQLLWDDPDPRAYGPYGLNLILRKHGLDLCI
ncbi:hypothetical protein B0I35DRAFT_437576, partial [Stachybotrys elegans]